MLSGNGKPGSFTEADIEQSRQAWSRKGAMKSMINWYRAAFRGSLRSPWNPAKIVSRRVSVPTLILWGKNDVALSYQMAQPSVDLCDDGRLVTFEHATHWVQHDEAEAVSQHLLVLFTVN